MMRSCTLLLVLALSLSTTGLWSQETGDQVAKLVPLNPQKTVLLDAAGKRLLLKSEVCLRDGLLEMLVCLKRTKEHEAILSLDSKAQIVHAGLLAIGLEPGKPVQHLPEFKPATGPILDITLVWTDAEGKPHRMPAQQWVRNSARRYWIAKLDPPPTDLQPPPDSDLRWDEKRKEVLWYGRMSDAQRDQLLKLSSHAAYQKAIRSFHAESQTKSLKADFVFAGSGFTTDKKTDEKYYQAEAGDLICVANFATATIDLATASSAAADDLLWEAYTERIPPVGTEIIIEIKARPKQP